MKTKHSIFFVRKYLFCWKYGIVGIFMLLFLGNSFISAPVYGDKIWTGTNGNWVDSTCWEGTDGTIYIGGGISEDKSATVTETGDLTLTDNIYIGYDLGDKGTEFSTKNPGHGTLDVGGDFVTLGSVYLGQQYGDNYHDAIMIGGYVETSGTGTLSVTGNLQIDGSLYMGRDGSASLTVAGDSVKIGNGSGSNVQIGYQLFNDAYKDPYRTSEYYSDIIKVDLSNTTDVTINVEGFYIAAYPATYKSSGGFPGPSSQRYQHAADVDFGTNTKITAEQMVIASSYGANLSTQQTLVEFGTGETTLHVDDFYIGYWKSENESDTSDSEMNYLHNIVSIRETESGNNTSSFTLQGKEGEGSNANLYIGYQECDTSNIATGTLNLSNASKATLSLNDLYIGYKKEGATGQNRTGASEGLLILGNNADLTANKITIAHKEIVRTSASKTTIGKLEMGGKSTVETGFLELGNSSSKLLLSSSYIEMNGGTFTVNKGAKFYDHINIAMKGGSFTINNEENPAEVPLKMYAQLKLNLSHGAAFTVEDTNIMTPGKMDLQGSSEITVRGEGTEFSILGNYSLKWNSTVEVTDDGYYLVGGDTTLQAGNFNWGSLDVSEVTKINENGTIKFTANNSAEIMMGNNLVANGEVAIVIGTAGNSKDNTLMMIAGNATFDSTKHEYYDNLSKDSSGNIVIPDTPAGYVSGKKITFDVNSGVCYIVGDTTATGILDINVTGGTFQTTDLIVNGIVDGNGNPIQDESGENIKGIVNVTVTGGEMILEHAYRDVIGGGIDFTLLQTGGTIIAKTVGVQKGQETHVSGTRPYATLDFRGGKLVVETLGSEHTPYYLDQSNHTYDRESGLVSVLSPGDTGTYGTTTIVGKVYRTDTRHAYNIADGTIHLDMGSGGRDSLTVLGSMNMKNATFEIQVNGSMPIDGIVKKGDEMIAYVTLATATEFYSDDETDGYKLFTGDGKAAFDGVANFEWSGDDDGTEWNYYISPLQTSSDSSTYYELRAYRKARADEVPEPGTITLMLLGFAALVGYCRHCSRNRGRS